MYNAHGRFNLQTRRRGTLVVETGEHLLKWNQPMGLSRNGEATSAAWALTSVHPSTGTSPATAHESCGQKHLIFLVGKTIMRVLKHAASTRWVIQVLEELIVSCTIVDLALLVIRKNFKMQEEEEKIQGMPTWILYRITRKKTFLKD